MRAFLILLLLANLTYLAWREGWVLERPTAPTSEEASFQPADEALVLLSELPAERLDLMNSLATARAARSGAQGQLQELQREFAAVENEIDENQAELAQDQARSAEVQQALLNTLDAAVEVEAAQLAPTPAPWCAVTAPFADQLAADAFASALADQSVMGAVEMVEAPVSSTWWVHMPAFPSEAAALAKVEELQARNIDSYYMRNGDMAGGISLGVYAREENARIAQRQLADQGYPDTSIREVFRMEERFRVGLRMPDGALRESAEWKAFLAAEGAVQLTEIACETVASENEFP